QAKEKAVGEPEDRAHARGWTPLMLACQEGHQEIARILLEKGVNMWVKSPHDKTALEIASENGWLGRADGRAITHSDNLARLVDANFLATLDRLPNLGDLEAKIEELDGRFDDVDDKIDTAESNLNDSLEDLDSKIDDVDSYIKDSRAISQNALLQEFWQLKELSKRDTLTEFVRSYKVQGYHHWGNQSNTETQETGTARTSGLVRVRRDWISPALRVAVQSHPEIAHRAFAVELGLDYDKIRVNMERDSSTDAHSTWSPGRKRRAESVNAAEPSDVAESSQQAGRRTQIKEE
ncbi:MAG: hypothetical protein Q9180_007622, partial [Flavoplaca navasiana]